MAIKQLPQALPWRVSRLFQATFTKNVAVMFFIQILALLLAIVQAALISRRLGPEGKGIVAVAMLAPQMLALFLGFGVDIACVRYIGSRKMDAATVTANALAFAALMSGIGLIIFVVMFVTGWLDRLMPGVPDYLWLIAFATFPLALLEDYLNGALQGLQRIVLINLATLFYSVILIVLSGLMVIWLNLSVGGAVLAYLGSSILKDIMLVVFVRRQGVPLGLRWDWPVIRALTGFGVKGYVGNVVNFFNYRLDSLLINFFMNPAEVGIYSVSVRLAEFLWVLPRTVAYVIMPKAAATDHKSMNRFTPKVFALTLGITLISALGFIVFGSAIIDSVFGPAFAGAYGPLLFLLPGAIMLASTKVLTSDITGRGYPQYNSMSVGVAFVLTVVLDITLIPIYGIYGAALVSSLAYGSVSILSVFFYLKVRRKSA
jgi:O-antigen/teichoic acid export membrane protein